MEVEAAAAAGMELPMQAYISAYPHRPSALEDWQSVLLQQLIGLCNEKMCVARVADSRDGLITLQSQDTSASACVLPDDAAACDSVVQWSCFIPTVGASQGIQNYEAIYDTEAALRGITSLLATARYFEF